MKNPAAAFLLALPLLAESPFPDPVPADVHNSLVAAELKKVDEVIAAGPFKPTTESLRKIGIPEWYADAKFGIFIHWGVYSVPAFGSEWYPRNMYDPKTKEFKHHEETYGPVSKFGYKDFIPQFTAANFDPKAWAELFKESGAKYVMPVAEHHDGFSLYDNPFTRWDSTEIGPKRDVIAELSDAIRAEGLKFCVSSHRAFNWAYFFRVEGADNTKAEWFDLYGEDQPYLYPNPEKNVFSGSGAHRHTWVSNQAFRDDWLARTADLVDRYKPDVIWFDFGIGRDKNGTTESNDHYALNQKFAAYFYNQAAKTGQQVAINYKWNAYKDGEAMLDIERGKLKGIRPKLWQTDTSVSYNSWGYVTNHNYKPVNVIVDDLIDIVSKNGVLLLNIGPKPDGSIPEQERTMLREIGSWLKTNGDGIYGSRPWKIFGEGPTGNDEGAHQEHKQKGYTAKDIRFTEGADSLYAWLMQWPESRSITIESLKHGNPHETRAVKAVKLLGGTELEFEQTATGLQIHLPAKPPTPHAHGLRISFAD